MSDIPQGPAVLLVSPHAGSAVGEAAITAALAEAGVSIAAVIDVRDLDAARPQGPAWQAQGIGVVIAAGGDGTVGSAATQIGDSGLALGILPLGTGNDSARSLGIPLDLAGACAVVADGSPALIDVGRARPLIQPGEAEGAPLDLRFVHTLQLGINVAFANLATDAARRERMGRLTYAASAVQALAQAQPVELALRLFQAKGQSDEVELRCRALQLAVVNLPVFGGVLGLRIPDISASDGLLHIIVIEAPEPPQLQSLLAPLLNALGQSDDSTDQASLAPANDQLGDEYVLPWVRRYAAQALTIETPEPLDVTLDGEVCAQTPLRINAEAGKLRVLLPHS